MDNTQKQVHGYFNVHRAVVLQSIAVTLETLTLAEKNVYWKKKMCNEGQGHALAYSNPPG